MKLLSLLCCVAINGALASGARPPLPQSEVPLSYSVRVTSYVAERKQGLHVDVELRNVSDRRVAVDPDGLWYAIEFKYSEAHDDGGFRLQTSTIMGHPDPDRVPDLVVLEAGGSLKRSKILPLTGDIFEHSGEYTVKVIYGQFYKGFTDGAENYVGAVSSNAEKFQLHI